MNWISIEAQLPPFHDEGSGQQKSYVLAVHSIYGVGVAWFYQLEHHQIEEELSAIPGNIYYCSCQFIKNELDGNYSIDDESNIDIFKKPLFSNLGTVTHWMPLPEPPNDPS